MGWLICIFFIKFISLSRSLIRCIWSIVWEFHLQIMGQYLHYFDDDFVHWPDSRSGNITWYQLNWNISSPQTLPGMSGSPCSSYSVTGLNISKKYLNTNHLVSGKVHSPPMTVYHQYSNHRNSLQRNEHSSKYIWKS